MTDDGYDAFMTAGVLAFHGDVAEHMEMLRALHAGGKEIRSVEDLVSVTHLIIPGGESTVMSRFLDVTGVGKEIRRRVKDNSLAVYGTCAGAILVARKITGKNPPRALGLIDIAVDRNAYGTQAQSFAADLAVRGMKNRVSAAFIRAPVITRAGKTVDVLATNRGNPVLVREGRVLAGTFHSEVRADLRVHESFLKM